MIYSTEELNQSELMNKKHKKVCKVYFYLLIVISTITGCVSISVFAI